MKGPIYQPSGRAREYSPYALNVYNGCTHRCSYCYAPRCMHMTADQYYRKPSPRVGIVEALTSQLKTERFDLQVLLSFVGDCFCETTDSSRAAIECLRVLNQTKTPTAILTKGGSRLLLAEREIVSGGKSVAVGATLTCDNANDSLDSEPGAAVPEERLDTLAHFHSLGVRTFASFEPVLYPAQSLALMRKCAENGIVDVFKIGKLNNDPREKSIPWGAFLKSAVEVMRGNGCEFYVKDDLAAFAPSVGVRLLKAERDADAHVVRRRAR